MRINVITKEDYDNDYSNLDLCSNMDIHPVVKDLYYEYQYDCNKLAYAICQGEHGEKRFYVYAWHTIQLPKRYFYVGKGTNNRYKHILKEIKQYKSGEQKNNPRYKKYSMIQDHCGIECEFLLTNLSEYESLLYEECVKLDFWKRGEVLLNVEGAVDDNKLPDGWRRQETSTVPQIESNPFIKKYIKSDEPYFDVPDTVKFERAAIYFGNVEEKDIETVEKQNKYIEKWLEHIGKKISSNPDAFIIQGFLKEENYLKLRDDNKLIFSAKDVLNLINHDITFSLKFEDIKLDPPAVDHARLDRTKEIANYLKSKLIMLGADERYIYMN